MLKIVKKYLFLHRITAFAGGLSVASTPVILVGAFLLVLHERGWIEAPGKTTLSLVLAVSALAWIPFYVKTRGSLLSIARRADLMLGSRGIVTAGTDMYMSGAPRSAWGTLIEKNGTKILSSARTSSLVPRRRYFMFLFPAAGALILLLSYSYTQLRAEAKVIDWKEKDSLLARPRIFNAVDEKLLLAMHEKLKKDLAKTPSGFADKRLENLKKEIGRTLSTFPGTDKELAEAIKRIERLKKHAQDIDKERVKQKEILQAIGKNLDGKLLEELGEKLEQKKTEEAAKAAEELAERLEESPPSSKSAEEAAKELAEGAESGKTRMEEEQGKSAGKENGEGKDGGEEKKGGMDSEKFDKLKKTLEKLDKLAKLFNMDSADKIPEGLKELAEEFSDMSLDEKQAKELKDLIDKLDTLKNMMVEAKEGKGKGKYSELRKDFEKKASGLKEGTPGKPGKESQGQEGAAPGGKGMKPGELKGEGTTPMESPGSSKEGGKGKDGPETPGQGKASQTKPDGEKKGQEGWGDGTAPHTGDPVEDGADASYEDMEVESKDSPGPIRKDVIKGASENGFVGADYKKIYEDYSSIVDQILEEEDVPSLYRYYVNKYFELISPREEQPGP